MSRYSRKYYNGALLDNYTIQAIKECEKRLGYSLTILQGSYNGGSSRVSASAGTHDGGGAVDLTSYDWRRKVHVLRAVGFAAWHRHAIPGLWEEHIHAILNYDRKASPAAKNQIVAYKNHRDGLAGNGYDGSWRPSPIHRFRYKPEPVIAISLSRLRTDFYLAYHHGYTKVATRRVKVAQRRLNKRDHAGLTVDGIVGPKTLDAWAHWEKRIGIVNRARIPDAKSLRRLLRWSIYFMIK